MKIAENIQNQGQNCFNPQALSLSRHWPPLLTKHPFVTGTTLAFMRVFTWS